MGLSDSGVSRGSGQGPWVSGWPFWICFHPYTDAVCVSPAPWGQPSPLCPGPGGLLAQKPGPRSHSSKEKNENSERNAGVFSCTQHCVCYCSQRCDGVSSCLFIGEQGGASLCVGLAAEDSGLLRGGKVGTTAYFPSPGSSSTQPRHRASAEAARMKCFPCPSVTLRPYICLLPIFQLVCLFLTDL